MQTLLLHGKLSSKQVMDLTCANINEKNRLQSQESYKQSVLAAAAAGQAKPAPYFPPPPMPVDQRRSINEVFRKLIAARYIIRANGLTMPDDPLNPDGPSNSSAAASTSGSSNVNADILATFRQNNAAVERQTQAAAEEATSLAGAQAAQQSLKETATSTKKRKKIADEDDDNGDEDAASKPARKKTKKTKKELEAEAAQAAKDKKDEEVRQAKLQAETEASASLERSAVAIDEDGDKNADHDDGHILWAVNHQQFLWEFRKRAVLDYVNVHIGPAAGFLIQQLLNQYPAEVCHPTAPERPPVYDTDAIFRMCERAAQEASVPNPIANLEMAEECLDQLLCDSTAFFERKTFPKGYIISKNNNQCDINNR